MSSNSIEQGFKWDFTLEIANSSPGCATCRQEILSALNATMNTINAAKVMMKEIGIPFSMKTLKNLMYNPYILKSFFEMSGLKPNRKINDKLVKTN